MSMRDKIEHAIQNQPCTVKELKQKFGGERGADRKVMEALDELVREAVVCQRQGVFFTVRSGRAFGQSAALAAKAGAKRLWLVHYSPMITDPEEELAQAQSLFPAAECGYDGKSITLQYEEAEE